MQVASFCAKGLLATYISREQEDENMLREMMDAKYKLVFFTPEMNKQWRQLLITDPYARNLRATKYFCELGRFVV